MSESMPEVEANYDNVSLLLAGIVAFLIDNDSNKIDVNYFSKDYSNLQIAVTLNPRSNEFEFEMKEIN
ncbi:MAG: hypothetical protein EBU08_03850 [Micrococcales bacterium]|nr:hypothetical protein [Micrococcales bacterium]